MDVKNKLDRGNYKYVGAGVGRENPYLKQDYIKGKEGTFYTTKSLKPSLNA